MTKESRYRFTYLVNLDKGKNQYNRENISRLIEHLYSHLETDIKHFREI